MIGGGFADMPEDNGQNGYAETQQPFAGVKVFRQKTEGGGKPEQQSQEMGELGRQTDNHGAAMHLLDLIETIFSRSSRCLFSRNPLRSAEQC